MLNIINRVVVVIALLVLIVVTTAVCVVPNRILTSLGEWMVGWGNYFDSVPKPWVRVVVGLLIAAVIDLVLLLLIVLEVYPRRKKFIRVQLADGGMASIGVESIVQQLQYKLDSVSGVLKVTPKVKAKGDKVQTTIHVEMAAGSNVPGMASRLMNIASVVLVEDLGLQVHDQPEVRIKVSGQPQDKPRPMPSEPAPAPVEPAPPPLPEGVSEERVSEERASDERAEKDAGEGSSWA